MMGPWIATVLTSDTHGRWLCEIDVIFELTVHMRLTPSACIWWLNQRAASFQKTGCRNSESNSEQWRRDRGQSDSGRNNDDCRVDVTVLPDRAY